MSWTDPKRVDDIDGFRFLPIPWWFRVLHPFNAETRHAALACTAYAVSRRRNEVIIKHPKDTQLGINHYPLWFVKHVLILQPLKRSLGLLILGIPFVLGLLVGMGIHISITIK